MKYTELTCYVNEEEHSDILVAFLSDYDYDSFYNETPLILKAYILSDKFNDKIIRQLQKDMKENIPFTYKVSVCKDENWNQVWEDNYDPVLIDDICYIRAPFHKKLESVQFDIEIQPKMSFGTAHHETTYQILSELLKIDVKDKSVLDMGCGTGVIAILAAMKGARKVWAIDNDEWAYNNTLENIERNNVDFIEAFYGDADLLQNIKFDFIFANINRNILISDLPKYVDVMNENSTIMMSGFYKEDIPLIKERSEKLELKYKDSRIMNKWAVVTFIR